MKQGGVYRQNKGMSMLLIRDGDAKSALSDELREMVAGLAHARELVFDEVELARTDVPPCIGCFQCMTKHRGRCINHRALEGLIQKTLGRRFVVYLSPALFGTFSAIIKNVVDHGGLIIGKRGTCVQIAIGYGDDLTDEEASTFIDIPGRHMGQADIVHPMLRGNRFEAFVSRCAADTGRVRAAMEGMLS